MPTNQQEPMVPPSHGIIHRVYKLHGNEEAVTREKAAYRKCRTAPKSQYKLAPPPGIPPLQDRPTSTDQATGRRKQWYRAQSNVKLGGVGNDPSMWSTQYSTLGIDKATADALMMSSTLSSTLPIPETYVPPPKGHLGGRNISAQMVDAGGDGDWTTSGLKDPKTVYPRKRLPGVTDSKVDLGKEGTSYLTSTYVSFKDNAATAPDRPPNRYAWDRNRSEVKFMYPSEGRAIPTYRREYTEKKGATHPSPRGDQQVWNRTSKDLQGVLGARVEEELHPPAWRKQQWQTMETGGGRKAPIALNDGVGYAFKHGATPWSIADANTGEGFRTEHKDKFTVKRGKGAPRQDFSNITRSFQMGQGGGDWRTMNADMGLSPDAAAAAAVARHAERPGATRFKPAPNEVSHSQVDLASGVEPDRMYASINSEYGLNARHAKVDHSEYEKIRGRGLTSHAPLDMGPLIKPPPKVTHYNTVHTEKLDPRTAMGRYKMGSTMTKSGVTMTSNTEIENPFGTEYRCGYRGGKNERRQGLPNQSNLQLFDMSACRNARDAIRLLGSV